VAGQAAAQVGGQGAPAQTPAAPATYGPSPTPPPPPGPTPEQIREQQREEALEAEIKALRQQQEELKTSLETTDSILGAEREQRAEEVIGLQERLAKAAAAAAAGVKITGYLQADWTPWRQSSEDQLNPGTGDLLNQDRFNIRRARLRASFEREYVAGLIEFDGNTNSGATARIIGAEASVKWPGEPQPHGEPPLLMLTFGQFKIPFGFEVGQSDRDRLFLERSTTERALFPGEYDLGVRLGGGWRFVRYVVAVQNGEPLGEKTWPGRDPNAAKDVTGRLGVDTPISEHSWIAGGFSALKGTGFHPGTPATKPSIQWVDKNEDGTFSGTNEIVTSPGLAATPSLNFPRFGYGVDLRFGFEIPGVGATTLGGEVYFAQNLDRGSAQPADPRGPLGRDSREVGAYGALVQEIGPYLQAGVRYDYYNPDSDSTNLSMGVTVPQSFSYKTLAGVVAFTLPGYRLSVEYDHNWNENGRTAGGTPTTLKDDFVTLRGQVSF
jgi:hypothetical protein